MQTVKVGRVQLLEALKAAKIKQQADYVKALKKYEEQSLPRYKERVIQAIEHELDLLRTNPEYLPTRNYDGVSVTVGRKIEPATKPTEPNTVYIDREIKLLELGAEDVIPVRTDSDWAKYL